MRQQSRYLVRTVSRPSLVPLFPALRPLVIGTALCQMSGRARLSRHRFLRYPRNNQNDGRRQDTPGGDSPAGVPGEVG
jgi:hypothetical protein